MIRPCRRLASILTILALALSASAARAQQDIDSPRPEQSSDPQSQPPAAQSPPPESQQPAAPSAPNPPPDAPKPTAPPDENPKRILDIIPNFQTVNETPQIQPPLTVKEKYILAYHQTVDFSAHFGNLFQAALQQASNGQPHYGQGWGPYAQRFGAAEADQVTSAFFIFGFIPHVLKEDPRYFRKASGSVWSRIRYAASRTVITRTDAGNPTFNAPQVFGQLAQQGISTLYYPQQDRSVSGVFQNTGINLAYNSAYNVLKEFYPDALRLVFHRHPKQDASVAAPTPQPAAPVAPTPPPQ
jgi:hypothetical protein